MKKHFIDLQYFADPEPTPEPTPTPTPEPTPEPQKTFTQAEVDAILDKRLARERKDLDTKIQTAVTEAQKLAKMTTDEREKHEREKRDKELADREGEITKRELRAQALETLAEKGLPKGLADLLPYVDADGTNAAIEATEKVFRAAVEQAVNERLKGTPPPASGKPQGEKEKLIAEYNEAQKRGDVTKMISIDAKIKALKKE
jgi:hypothetical protein